MNDTDLDRLLSEADPSQGEAPRSLDQLVTTTHARSTPRRVRARATRRRLIAGGALLLAGGLTASITADGYLLSAPPFVGLSAHELRATEWIPFTPAAGEPDEGEACRLYPEFRNLTTDQLRAIDTTIREHDWRDLGELAEQRAAAASTEAEAASATSLIVYEALAGTVPGMTFRGGGDGPEFIGYSMTCRSDLG